ncbi:MAG: hypothetical protein NTV43_13560 [Methylococcales bacterium]|nr:hypothetical protein [Methylococcales bacterium]
MKQVTELEWNEAWSTSGYLIQLCQLPYSVKEIESLFSLSSFEYTEDGLGTCFGIYISIEDQLCFLLGFHDKEDKTHSVLVQVKNFESNLPSLLNKLCQEFKVNENSLIWVNLDL